MWQQAFEWFRRVFAVTQDMAELQREVAELRQSLSQQAKLTEQLVAELKTLSETERLERENLILRLKVELLQFRQTLPPTLPPGKPKDE